MSEQKTVYTSLLNLIWVNRNGMRSLKGENAESSLKLLQQIYDNACECYETYAADNIFTQEESDTFFGTIGDKNIELSNYDIDRQIDIVNELLSHIFAMFTLATIISAESKTPVGFSVVEDHDDYTDHSRRWLGSYLKELASLDWAISEDAPILIHHLELFTFLYNRSFQPFYPGKPDRIYTWDEMNRLCMAKKIPYVFMVEPPPIVEGSPYISKLPISLKLVRCNW